jgi:hypothetical protein
MTTVVHVACYGSTSLRDRVVHDKRLADYALFVSRTRMPGRNPGWAKLYGSDYGIKGAINLEWDGDTRTLLARVVTRGKGKPDVVVGSFVAYLLGRHRARIRSITVHPE